MRKLKAEYQKLKQISYWLGIDYGFVINLFTLILLILSLSNNTGDCSASTPPPTVSGFPTVFCPFWWVRSGPCRLLIRIKVVKCIYFRIRRPWPLWCFGWRGRRTRRRISGCSRERIFQRLPWKLRVCFGWRGGRRFCCRRVRWQRFRLRRSWCSPASSGSSWNCPRSKCRTAAPLPARTCNVPSLSTDTSPNQLLRIIWLWALQVSHNCAFTFILFFSVTTLYANSTPIVELTWSYVPFTYLYSLIKEKRLTSIRNSIFQPQHLPLE